MNELESLKAIFALGGCARCGRHIEFDNDTPFCRSCRGVFCLFCSKLKGTCEHWIPLEKLKYRLPMPVWPAAHPAGYFTKYEGIPPEYFDDQGLMGLLSAAGSTSWLNGVASRYKLAGGLITGYLERYGGYPFNLATEFFVSEVASFKKFVAEESIRHDIRLHEIDSIPPAEMVHCRVRLERPSTGYRKAHWSPDGRFVALAGEKSVPVFDSSTGELVARFATTGKVSDDIQFAENSKELFISGGRTIRKWSIQSGKAVGQEMFDAPQYVPALRPQLRQLPESMLDKYLPIVERDEKSGVEARLLSDGQRLAFKGKTHRLTAQAFGLTLSEDGKFCAIFTKRTIKLFDEKGLVDHHYRLSNLEGSRCRFIAGSDKLWIHGAYSSQVLDLTGNEYGENINEITFSSDEKLVVNLGSEVLVLDGPTFGLLREINKILRLQESATAGKDVVVITDSESVSVYDWRRDVTRLKINTPGLSKFAELSPCERFLLTGGEFPPAIWEIPES